MNFLSENFRAVAKTFLGLEPALELELKELGYTNATVHNRAVSFETDLSGLYKANLALRTALHVLVPLVSSEINHGKELYDLAYQIAWENIFKTTDEFVVASVIKSKLYKHTNYPALLVKDAIADRFREKLGARPNVGRAHPDIVVTVHVFNNKAEIFLDASGESLHRRGYRLEKVEAPLNEVLAAGLIILSGWNKETTFLDPMCGSGTIPIEAAMYARNIPPNLYRKNFAFKNWKNFDLPLFTKIKNQLKKQITESEVKIYGSDISQTAVEIAQANAKRAKVAGFITFEQKSFFDYKNDGEKKFLIINPPYDERLKSADIKEFYRKIGDALKNNFQNSVAWIFSGNKQAIKQIGLSASKKYTLNNGGIESYFRRYEIFQGSKKK